jgi:hypothetical protein
MKATELKDRLDRIQRLVEEAGEIIQEDYNKEKSAFKEVWLLPAWQQVLVLLNLAITSVLMIAIGSAVLVIAIKIIKYLV